MRCADCNDTAEPLTTCDDRVTRCPPCTVAAGFCVCCGREAVKGICDTCFTVRRFPAYTCPGCGRDTSVVINGANCPSCLGED